LGGAAESLGRIHPAAVWHGDGRCHCGQLLVHVAGLASAADGTIYAVWTCIGAAGGLAWGILMQGEPAGALRITCVGLILAGVAGLCLG